MRFCIQIAQSLITLASVAPLSAQRPIRGKTGLGMFSVFTPVSWIREMSLGSQLRPVTWAARVKGNCKVRPGLIKWSHRFYGLCNTRLKAPSYGHGISNLFNLLDTWSDGEKNVPFVLISTYTFIGKVIGHTSNKIYVLMWCRKSFVALQVLCLCWYLGLIRIRT